jgi:hypothetical protein
LATLTIDLPEPMKEYVLAKSAEAGYATPDEFVLELLRTSQRRDLIERKLLEALDKNDFEEVTPDFWERLRACASTGAAHHGET